MFIINRYNISTSAPVVSTNDTNAITGQLNNTWAGANPVGATGATGNAGTGSGLTNLTTTGVYTDQVISKLVAINFAGTLTPGADNFIRVPLSQLGITGIRVVLGATIVGVYDPNSNEATGTPSLMTVTSQAYVSVVRDCVVLRILAANLALFQNKVANILLIYT